MMDSTCNFCVFVINCYKVGMHGKKPLFFAGAYFSVRLSRL